MSSTTDTSTAPATEAAPKQAPNQVKAPAKKETAPKPVPTEFESIANSLASAEQRAKASSADASQARAQRQTAAVDAIKAAHSGKIDGAIVRSTLLSAGVLKGTVSKIVTVLDALAAKTLTISNVKSLNGAYSLVKAAERAAFAATLGIPATGGTTAAPAGPVHATTPDEAVEIILAHVRGAGSDDAVMKAAQKYITAVTDGISAIMSGPGKSADE